MNKLEIRAHAAPWHNGVDLLVMGDGEVGEAVKMVKRKRYAPCDPTLQISNDQAQTLMDDLWSSGLRPTEGSGSAGSLRATENHLNDMRKIAFKGLKMEEGK